MNSWNAIRRQICIFAKTYFFTPQNIIITSVLFFLEKHTLSVSWYFRNLATGRKYRSGRADVHPEVMHVVITVIFVFMMVVIM
jgi:hypothetical protein